ncbi:asparagine synthase-related protein [Streptomyces carpaticus]|uniref:asparagine synthase-related protein n=1 Tax=Streptomyces carpaticus TaxID=285558 RepID=UPI0031F866F9
MPEAHPEWFVVLPGDDPAARRAAAVLSAAFPGATVLARIGDRPWIMGRADRPVTTAHCGHAVAALIGIHPPGTGKLAAAVHRLRPGSGPGQLAAAFPGSFHVVLADHQGGTWVCGDAAGIRPVFTATIAGATVAGDHARILARATGNVRLDAGHLARYQLGPVPPLPLAENGTTPYLGVRAITPGAAVRIDAATGRANEHPWWSPPDDEHDLADSAEALRAAMDEAVRLRIDTYPNRPVGCELSGGMDSTALSALAYRHAGARLVNLTRLSMDPGNDDLRWASVARAAQPAADHLITRPGEIPGQLDGLSDASLVLDAPGPMVCSPARSTAWWNLAAGTGARLLLSGKGGDECTLTPLTYLSHARSRDRRTARRHVAGWAALWGTSRAAVAGLPEAGPYGRWLATCAAPDSTHRADWEAAPRLPQWLAPHARRAITEELADAASCARPLHDRPHQHTAVAAIRSLARLCRLQADAAASCGITMAYPYTDRAVIEAALACRAEARTSPYQLKPLATAAMRSHLPDAYLTRRTKGGYSADLAAGRRRHHATLVRVLTRDSALADLGIIDPPALAAAVRRWGTADPAQDLLMHLTLSAELFARTAGRPHPAFEEVA